MSPLFFGEKRPLKRVMELARCSGFVHGISDRSGLDGPARLRKSYLPQHPSKMAQRGLVWERGGVSLLRLQKPHTGPHRRDSGGDSSLLLPVFIIPPFSGPIPKVFFFVYAAQFLYRRLHPSIPLIMFYRTLLGDMETLSFPFHRCDRMCFLKLPQNWPKPVFLWSLVLFPSLD